MFRRRERCALPDERDEPRRSLSVVFVSCSVFSEKSWFFCPHSFFEKHVHDDRKRQHTQGIAEDYLKKTDKKAISETQRHTCCGTYSIRSMKEQCNFTSVRKETLYLILLTVLKSVSKNILHYFPILRKNSQGHPLSPSGKLPVYGRFICLSELS